MTGELKFIPTVTPAELKRGIEVSQAAKDQPVPDNLTVPGIGITITDNILARMHIGLIKEFGERSYPISMRLSILAHAAEGLGEHFIPPDKISEEAIAAMAEMMVIEWKDPGAAGILAAIKARRGR